MKRIVFCLILGICTYIQAFAEPIPVKIVSYLIGRRETAAQYLRGELIINDEEQSWEIVLYKKNNADPERIKLEKFDDIGRNIGVFRSITVREASGTLGSNLFAYMPAFEDNKIRVDLCDTRTEGVKRRLVISSF
ncbi:MAG: hypothetical protein LBQ44_10705 [Treponema sp.]|jgi:hypothetical protein|nr:hypothetical protein [Treponema sp.]